MDKKRASVPRLAFREGRKAPAMNENIIAINLPNAISIVIMAAVGALVFGAVKKLLTGGGLPLIQRGANTTLYNAA